MYNELLKRAASSLILIPLALFFIIKGSYFFTFFIVISFLIASYEWHSMSKKKSYYYFGFIFLIFSFFSIYWIRIYENTYEIILFVLIACIFTDIGGYIFGKIFNGPKLTKISPNKTYSGVVGGYLLSILGIYFFSIKFLYDQFTINYLLICIFISTISQIGDIIISYFKRLSNIKDTGNLIPGHGGILDRIDGMIFAFPVLYFVMNYSGYLKYYFEF